MDTIFDSNVWIAFLNEGDALHVKGREKISACRGIFIIPEYVCIEVSTILQQRKKKDIADTFLKTVLSDDPYFQFLPSSPELVERTVEIFLNQSQKLSFVDCALLAYEEEYKIVTFDESLEKALK